MTWPMRGSHFARGSAKLSPILEGVIELTNGETKLRRRGSLPGAFGYDLAAAAFRGAIARGCAPESLLSAAMPTSWMVNNRAPSTLFAKWLRPPLAGRWAALLELLEGGYAAHADISAADRSAIAAHVDALCMDGHGVAAVSKVLALLLPQSVPLMDDSAIALLTGGVARPADDRSPTAGAEHFLPVLDAFSAQVAAHEADLIALARDYDLAPLDAPQVLDRLLWYDSFGHRHFPDLNP